ncbi:MAG: ASKHA domain-containing protein [Desulfatirhabdiaceae bacterium]|nr:ASKHA domain-containing protein [Desulfatirhabdiaceae bacterium]
MTRIGIALDLGTSGFRGQALDLDRNGMILSTAVTTRHPLPGANVIDHLHFALEIGLERTHQIVLDAVNTVIDNLRVEKDRIVRVAVCGNPIQLSLFQKIEFRDLAYAGKRKLDALGVVPPKRDAMIVKAHEISGLALSPEVDVLIPPAVRHEIGADALAMMIQTGMLDQKEIVVVTDYGTNNEIALLVNGKVYTGSTAAGPALEGQHIEDGLLALPGAISDVEFEPETVTLAGCSSRTSGRLNLDNNLFEDEGNGADSSSSGCLTAATVSDKPIKGRLKTFVLDQDMHARSGDTVDPNTGRCLERGENAAVGITGTGVVGLISQCLKARLIKIPRITTLDTEIHLPNGLKFTEKDLLEAGKAIGAVRAGHLTLCHEAGIELNDISVAYCSGASGTYVDAIKAQEIGMIPAGVKKIYQVGNTSLAMARDVVKTDDALWNMKKVADDLRQHHCMFAASKTFEKVYILELAFWTEGMPFSQYRKFLKKYGLPEIQDVIGRPEVIKTVQRDIPDLGQMGLKIVSDIGRIRSCRFDGCIGCEACVTECPENALKMETENENFRILISLALCDGVACRRCERVCKEKVFDLIALITSTGE